MKKTEQDFARDFFRLSSELALRLKDEPFKSDAEDRFLRGFYSYAEFLKREERRPNRKNLKLIEVDDE